MRDIKTVTLLGLGAIGAFFADKMQPILGENFRVIAAGERAARIKKDGLVINGKQEYFNVVSPTDTSGAADLVIVISKMTDLENALDDVKNQVGSETVIMVPLNGVESEEAAAAVYGWDRVVYSTMRVSSVKSGNAVTFDPSNAFVEFGERTNELSALSPNVQRIKNLFEKVGINSKIRSDMLRAIWEKFVCNVSENQLAAVLDIPFGAWGTCDAAEKLRIMVADEVIQIARKKGIMIEPDYARNHLEHLKKIPVKNKPSTLQDILAGRKTEKEMFAGTVMRLGKETGVETPLNEFLYYAIKVLEDKNDGTVAGV